MNKFKRNDRVIVSPAVGIEYIGTVQMLNGAVPNSSYYDVKFDSDNRVLAVPASTMRLKCSDPGIAQGIVQGLSKIEKLRKEIDKEFEKLVGLYAVDGQPTYEQDKIEHMRITHKGVLRYDIAGELTYWEGYLQERKK